MQSNVTPEGGENSASSTEAGASERPAAASPRPWLTWILGAICIVVFAGIKLSGADASWAVLSRWGAPPANQIWHGAYWALVTSVFVHLALWHLAFNLYWLWILGRTLETAIGPWRWLAFFLVSAVVSSAAELAASGETGIGLSGVIYAVFGFMWMTRIAYPAFARVVTSQTVNLFLAWLVLCVFLTMTHIWAVANAAHVSGLVFGAVVGRAFVVRPRSLWPKAAAVTLTAAAILVLFWCPWRFEWVATKAYDAQTRGDYESALDWYHRCERFPEHSSWVSQNVALVYMSMGDADRYLATLERLRRLDPEKAREVERRAEEPSRNVTPRPD